MSSTATQKELFEAIHNRYYDATTDKYAEAYKDEFVYRPVLSELGTPKSLIELASGVGSASGWFRKHIPGLDISGCDISDSAAKDYRTVHDAPCHVWDLTKPIIPERTYDAVIVMGGIHHLVADLSMAFANIARLLNPGGRLVMVEPSADFVLEPLRQLWYKIDKANFDADNEHALSHDPMFKEFGADFNLRNVRAFGGPAYFLLLQNWVLRVPGTAKAWIAPPLMAFERLYHRLPTKAPFSSFIATWEKR
jgi:SAM-dependent methyltransferase